MKFINLDGSEISVNIQFSQFPKRTQVSRGHLKVREALENLIPNYDTIEEFPLPRTNGLKLDFFIPSLSVAIEVDGLQHDKFVKHFHGDIDGFRRAKQNDRKKNRWCEINDIHLIRLKKDWTVEQLEDEIYA